MNELADETCGLIMTGLSYRLVAVVNDNTLLMEVTGEVTDY
jgi:hypothetical protein